MPRDPGRRPAIYQSYGVMSASTSPLVLGEAHLLWNAKKRRSRAGWKFSSAAGRHLAISFNSRALRFVKKNNASERLASPIPPRAAHPRRAARRFLASIRVFEQRIASAWALTDDRSNRVFFSPGLPTASVAP